jgi:hypothetical protein
MAPRQNSRRTTVYLLGGALALVIVILAALQAFNMRFLTPESTEETIVFAALTVLVFLLLMTLMLLLLRNILKLYADQRSSALGSRLRTRMVLGAALIAFTPAVFMFLFSFGLLNRSIDRWFSQPTSELRDDSTRVVEALGHYAATNARIEAEEVASLNNFETDSNASSTLASHHVALVGGFAAVYDADQKLIAGYQLPGETTSASLLPWLNDPHANVSPLNGPFSASLLHAAQRSDEAVLLANKYEYALGLASTKSGKLVVVALPIPAGLTDTAVRIRSGASDYWALFRLRNRIRTTYVLMLLLITAFVFFASMWLALFLAKQITRPVEALADAMDEIAAGKYDHRVPLTSTGEMAELVRAFNHMAADLESSRNRAEISAAQLQEATLSIEERRRELETIVETIPSGVVTLDAKGCVLQANRAFAIFIGRDADERIYGQPIDSLLPSDCIDDVLRIIRRSQRMGAASVEIETQIDDRNMHLSITSARLDLAAGVPGAVLVIEDTSELLRAQRQLAWKEVAQRVAHEIKNPLTPISLSAERIRRHLDSTREDSPAIIRKCSEVILGCVATLRTLVDQFSALAQFPAPRPRACDANQVVEEVLALFTGRLEGITVQTDFAALLPPLMADPDSLRRALANLVDNAAEAMRESLLRVLTIRTALTEDGSAIEIAVADTGHGLTDEIRERLFLPFYSTKQRGTGLGLSIAAKIAQEHNGSIRAEQNTPKGARFILRLPLVELHETEVVEAESAAKSASDFES